MFKEVNTGTNLPAQIDIYADQGNAYKFHFIAKGGGSANKTFLYQQTKALLNPDSLMKFVNDNIKYTLSLLSVLSNAYELSDRWELLLALPIIWP